MGSRDAQLLKCMYPFSSVRRGMRKIHSEASSHYVNSKICRILRYNATWKHLEGERTAVYCPFSLRDEVEIIV